MKGLPEDRAVLLAEYIIEKGATVRAAAREFRVSKSTVHKDVSERLRKLNPVLYAEVRTVLDRNRAERHLRGGMATKLKYEALRSGEALPGE
ncbi:MAG TPA: sporulation transcriptional regulator SpoIIID [Oscillospiraceae bacterium]|jgi:putative DeoR family transcriptional regulator (stage III sporulation protein D)|nr:sporulation transcriptional regulator SpoIIID [Oscillospiraceae bacterium]HRW56773.1 sporulation transcriptional regulator SpoIIID [Oscillospiraceae bacterium]